MSGADDTVERVRALVDRGATDDARALARAALPGATGADRAGLLLALSTADGAAGRYLDALRGAAEASELYRVAARSDGLCDAITQVAATLRAAGDHAGGLTTLEQAESLARSIDDPLRLGRVLRAIGISCSVLGRHHHALSCLAEAEELLGRHAPAAEHRWARLSLLNARSRQMPPTAPPAGTPEAEAYRAEIAAQLDGWQALARDAAATGHARLEVMALGNHAITLQPAGRHREAIAGLAALLPRYREYGMKPNEGLCHAELARCHETLGEWESARTHYRLALEILREGGVQDDLLESLDGLSRAEEALGAVDAALAALRELRALEKQRSDAAARQAVHQRELRIELARLTSQWARLATTDPLTGLGNRRALERWLDEHWPRIEHGESLVLLLLDLDHFKRINDGFGHDTGDDVLRAVAGLLQSHCRASDLAVRYGGEEFLLAMSAISRDDAEAAAHRLRATVAAHPWNEVAPGLVVTTSIGLADGAEALDPAALLTLADRRLYAAKYGGRNRVVVVD